MAKRGDSIEIDVDKFADKGLCVGRLDGIVVLTSGAAPGDRVRALVTRKKKQYLEARTVEILIEGPDRVEPRCRYFGVCGGCTRQHVAYDAQLFAKQMAVLDALEHRGGLTGIAIEPIIGCEPPFFYRNKMEFSFSAWKWLTPEEIASDDSFERGFSLGLHVPGNYEKALDIEECFLQSELSVAIVNETRAYGRANRLSCWSTRAHDGLLRHLVIRHGVNTGETLVNIVANGSADDVAGLAEHLKATFDAITTCVSTDHRGLAQISDSGERTVHWGRGAIRERIGDLEFEISPTAFFQPNTRQAEKLYGVVADFAELTGSETVYDLYCGAGAISLYLARAARNVVGIEIVEDAVRDARRNADLNSITNCRFFHGDVSEVVTESFVTENGQPGVVVLDPPRAGLHPKTVAEVIRIAPKRIVYVSCNPQTQARDLALLAETYSIIKAQPVDLFPQTHHLENVALLTRR
ncbi:MAG: 23S rRNA (uracil(1939)-C(5))-methyltransferase RlmD [Spirochaetaceae bacterium]|nr:MAG: 23S rRNA (uracil(1939)-C(5))-methyltransferase RlmD [Spirochaetaceae bacterium]